MEPFAGRTLETDGIVVRSDSVTRVNDSNRVNIFGDWDSTCVTLRSIRLESSHVFRRMTRLKLQSMTRDSSQSHFYKIFEPLIDKPSSFAHKEMSTFCFSDDQDWHEFSVLTV